MGSLHPNRVNKESRLVNGKVIIAVAALALGVGCAYLGASLVAAARSAAGARHLLQAIDSSFGRPVSLEEVQAWTRKTPGMTVTRTKESAEQKINYTITYSNRMLAWSRITDLSGISFVLTVNNGTLAQVGVLAGTTNRRTGAWIYADTWLFAWGQHDSSPPRYQAFQHLLANGTVAGLWVGIHPGASPLQVHRSLNFNTRCMEGFHRCWSAPELLPGVARDAKVMWVSR